MERERGNPLGKRQWNFFFRRSSLFCVGNRGVSGGLLPSPTNSGVYCLGDSSPRSDERRGVENGRKGTTRKLFLHLSPLAEKSKCQQTDSQILKQTDK